MCKTVHQMAMAKCGFMFRNKMTSNLRAKDMLDSGLLSPTEFGGVVKVGWSAVTPAKPREGLYSMSWVSSASPASKEISHWVPSWLPFGCLLGFLWIPVGFLL